LSSLKNSNLKLRQVELIFFLQVSLIRDQKIAIFDCEKELQTNGYSELSEKLQLDNTIPIEPLKIK